MAEFEINLQMRKWIRNECGEFGTAIYWDFGCRWMGKHVYRAMTLTIMYWRGGEWRQGKARRFMSASKGTASEHVHWYSCLFANFGRILNFHSMPSEANLGPFQSCPLSIHFSEEAGWINGLGGCHSVANSINWWVIYFWGMTPNRMQIKKWMWDRDLVFFL